MRDLQILKDLNIPPHLHKAPKITTILWHPPTLPWIKVNTDGLSKGNPGLAACAGIFRNNRAEFIGGFSMPLGVRTSFYAEFMAFLVAIEIANSKGWFDLWLESDSMSVIQCFLNPLYLPPWELHVKWRKCCHILSRMRIKITHIHREGNFVADKLVNVCFIFNWLV